ncbi:hypothetical protein GUITHDRAFT_112341 [Guillardia theta CCMP2712]|uniref:PDZ domain-containing protein n=1 Tax=Guillardia theta (strain CCMP2712) TaxID=905079 RepID=L1J0L3_GUITC|nr:hypothetical protein GUITHDRAFT_112341 [Guillardia theta CCMP2712]EKX41635.1 hypothetical protein GUITHDRAFT_112341 [Guillardia theta CCMP2712]|eukprot:XP_005828615.1 hypothetical protein GUITHDRAFT_112341 [Guillardia theta CCMP2712]
MIDADDYNPEEEAVKVEYDVEACEWKRTTRKIMIGKDFFDSGEKFGCVFVRDVLEGQVHVIKRLLHAEEPPEAVYETVRTEAIACSMADCYNTYDPPKKVTFVPTFIYLLVGRAGQPAVRVEPYIHNFRKEPVRTLTLEHRLDLDTLEAFELFTYERSQASFVLVDPFYISDLWYRPTCHSVDGEASDGMDLGLKGIQLFLVKHRYNPVCQKLGLRNPSCLLGLRSEDRTLELPAVPSASSLPPSKTPGASVGGRTSSLPRSIPRSGTKTKSRKLEERGRRSKSRASSSSSNRNGMAGMQLEIANRQVTVLRVCKDGPADQAGLRRGHVIRTIGGVAVKGMDMAAVQRLLEGKHGAVKRIVAANSVVEQDLVFDMTLAAGIVVNDRFLFADTEEVWDEDFPSQPQQRHDSKSSSQGGGRETGPSESQTYVQGVGGIALAADSTGIDDDWETVDVEAEAEEADEEEATGGVAEFEEEEELGDEEKEEQEQELNKEVLVVGRDVPILLGMRVRMLPEYMQHGTGSVQSANFLRKYVAVKWDDGWEDSCLYVGGGGEYYLRQWREGKGRD